MLSIGSTCHVGLACHPLIRYIKKIYVLSYRAKHHPLRTLPSAPLPCIMHPLDPYTSSPIDTARQALTPRGGPWPPTTRSSHAAEETWPQVPLVSWKECYCRRPHPMTCVFRPSHTAQPQPVDKMNEDVQRGLPRSLDFLETRVSHIWGEFLSSWHHPSHLETNNVRIMKRSYHL